MQDTRSETGAVTGIHLDKDYSRLLTLATKHCPNDHPDFEEIKRIAGAAPSDAAGSNVGITLDSFMSLTYEERRDMMQAYHEAAWACHIVMMMSNKPPMSPEAFDDTCNRYSHGNRVAARIAKYYLTLGKDAKLPIVPPEWYKVVENALYAQETRDAQDALYAQNAQDAQSAKSETGLPQ